MKNKITWIFERLEKGEEVYRGSTESGTILYGVKDGDKFKDIQVVFINKKVQPLSPYYQKLSDAKDVFKDIDWNKTFVMYERHSLIDKGYWDNDKYWVSLYKKGRVTFPYGWTIVGKLYEVNNRTYMRFHVSKCSKKDNYCKKIGLYEALNNTFTLNIELYFLNPTYSDYSNLFTTICKSTIIPKIEKTSKLRC